jgi:2-methylcitrate dehydratase PrpD
MDNKKRMWSSEVELAKGEPENPASWEEIYNKFYTNATLLLSEKDAKKLGETIMKLEDFALDRLTKFL